MDKVKTPKGVNISYSNKGGTVHISFQLSSIFERNANYCFGNAQKVMDSEIIRLSKPYVPWKKGTLANSVDLATIIGSGKIVWSTPYAKRRYYEGPLKGIKGPYWVERMLPTSLPQILNAVKGEIKKI